MTTSSLRPLVLALVACAGAGCEPPPLAPFALRVSAVTDEGVALPGLGVRIDERLVGVTDERGELRSRLSGRDAGKRVRVAVQTPDGYRAIEDAKLVSLERLQARGGQVVPFEVEARFAPRVRRYAVLVDVGQAGLPVQVYGVQKAVTNGAGQALLLASGTPSDALEVRVLANRPDLRPRFVAQTFNLKDRADVFVLDGKFTRPVKKKVIAKPHVPARL